MYLFRLLSIVLLFTYSCKVKEFSPFDSKRYHFSYNEKKYEVSKYHLIDSYKSYHIYVDSSSCFNKSKTYISSVLNDIKTIEVYQVLFIAKGKSNLFIVKNNGVTNCYWVNNYVPESKLFFLNKVKIGFNKSDFANFKIKLEDSLRINSITDNVF